MAWIKTIIQSLIRNRFHGNLIIHFKDGKIMGAEKQEKLKPESV